MGLTGRFRVPGDNWKNQKQNIGMFGLLNINKPEGLTSRKVVDHVQRLVRPAKAGHAGTLDPLATGVLVVSIGPATRLISLVQDRPKTYRGTFRLGCHSDTDDITGNVEAVPRAAKLSQAEIESCLREFVGQIEQVPPQFSAVHIKGKRAYELARQGQAVDIAPKTVEVYRSELSSYRWPELSLEIECGSGTYIRSIGRDLGRKLGCGAVMTALVRTRIGPFDLTEAVSLDDLDHESLPSLVISPRKAVEHLPSYRADVKECRRLKQGQRIEMKQPLDISPAEKIAILTSSDELAALAEFDPDANESAPRQVFLR